MNLDLQFRLMPAMPPMKLLMSYRKDAKLDTKPPRVDASGKHGKVQWVAVDRNNKQIGMARLEMAPPEFCFVSDLIILSPHRGRGVGSWFLRRIEQYCVSTSIKRLLLEASEGTDQFYKAQAFVDDPLLPRLMRKELNPFQPRMFTPMAR